MAESHGLLARDIFGASSEPMHFSGLVADWPAVRRWTPDYLESLAKDRTVSVVSGNREYGSPVFKSMPLAEFFQRCFSTEALGPRLYLKEYDLLQELPELKNDIDLSHFKFPDAQSFHDAWVGQQGARTGLHCDIFSNFLIQVSGTKELDLIPPQSSLDVYPSRKFDYCARLSQVDGFEPDLECFPRFQRAQETIRKFRLEPGDAVYIPQRWWHQVVSLTPTISLSGFIVGPADKKTYALERWRKRLHNLGVYRRGNCTCHE